MAFLPQLRLKLGIPVEPKLGNLVPKQCRVGENSYFNRAPAVQITLSGAANNAPDANQFGLDDNLIVCRYFLLHQTLVVIFGSARLSGNGDGRNKAARNEGRWEMPASCAPMSAIGTKRTSPSAQHMSAVQPKADTHHCAILPSRSNYRFM